MTFCHLHFKSVTQEKTQTSVEIRPMEVYTQRSQSGIVCIFYTKAEMCYRDVLVEEFPYAWGLVNPLCSCRDKMTLVDVEPEAQACSAKHLQRRCGLVQANKRDLLV